jgi:hypothetical protein
MRLRKDKVIELMNTQFKGNYNQFSKTLGLDVGHLHKYLIKDIGGGKKLIGAVMKYCRDNGLDVFEYVEL